MKKTIHTTKKIIQIKLGIIMTILLPFIVFTLITSKTDKLFGIQSFVVLTGSMNPAIPQGSVIFASKQQDYKNGEVIAFRQGNIVITHRIIDEVEKNSSVFYRTQGDANNAADVDLVASKDVLGKAENRIPYVGNIILFIRTLPGFITFIVVPTLLFVVFELWAIKREIEKSTEKKVLARMQGMGV